MDIKIKWAIGILIPLCIAINAFVTSWEPRVDAAQEVKRHEAKVVMIEVKIDWTKDRIIQEIDTDAHKYGVSAQLMKKLIQCESGFDTDIRSNHILSYGREQSYGLVQIHLPAHPDVSKEEAIDPTFAIDFMARNIAAGRKDMWSCSKMI